ncbi:MAG: hypothetical protein KatS3mg030_554 [Saprospiraceae bacterium]|nr:MAG: hypothetical protein KatS3mg030_554 [Saprospiraceae bacterium]
MFQINPIPFIIWILNIVAFITNFIPRSFSSLYFHVFIYRITITKIVIFFTSYYQY